MNEERRIHARVQVATEVRVTGPEGVAHGTLRDVSKSGAAVYIDYNIGSIGDTVELFLPFSGGVEIAVMAEILRLQETERGILHGVRFSLVEPTMQEKLLDCIDTLLQAGDAGRRNTPRLSKRIPMKYKQASELKAMLQNISLGGLAMLVQAPLVLYEEVEVSIPDTNGKELLIVNGRVIYQHPLEGNVKGYRVGLQFKDLSSEAEACLKGLLDKVLNDK